MLDKDVKLMLLYVTGRYVIFCFLNVAAYHLLYLVSQTIRNHVCGSDIPKKTRQNLAY